MFKLSTFQQYLYVIGIALSFHFKVFTFWIRTFMSVIEHVFKIGLRPFVDVLQICNEFFITFAHKDIGTLKEIYMVHESDVPLFFILTDPCPVKKEMKELLGLFVRGRVVLGIFKNFIKCFPM